MMMSTTKLPDTLPWTNPVKDNSQFSWFITPIQNINKTDIKIKVGQPSGTTIILPPNTPSLSFMRSKLVQAAKAGVVGGN